MQTDKSQGQGTIQHKEESISHSPIREEGEKTPADMLVCKPTIACTWEELWKNHITKTIVIYIYLRLLWKIANFFLPRTYFNALQI